MAGGGGATGDALAAAHARVLADHSLQFAFSPSPRPARDPAWLPALLHWLESLARHAPHRSAPAWTAYWPWLVLFIVIAGALALLARGFVPAARRRPGRTAAMRLEGDDDWRPDAYAARALLEDADRLAQQERFAEAAHILLFRSIADLEMRVATGIGRSLTSRDIAALPGLPTAPRAAFASIAATVERAVFGEVRVGPTDWAACREAYLRFAFDPSWTAT